MFNMTETVWDSMRGYATSRKKSRIRNIALEEAAAKKDIEDLQGRTNTE